MHVTRLRTAWVAAVSLLAAGLDLAAQSTAQVTGFPDLERRFRACDAGSPACGQGRGAPPAAGYGHGGASGSYARRAVKCSSTSVRLATARARQVSAPP